MNHAKIELSYEKDGFRTNQYKSIFYDHVTEINFKEDVNAIKKVIKSVLKTSDIMITIQSMDSQYNTTEIIRYCLRHGMWNNAFDMDYRPWNGHDYGDKNPLTFVSESQMVLWTNMDIKRQLREILGDIPEKECLYSQSFN